MNAIPSVNNTLNNIGKGCAFTVGSPEALEKVVKILDRSITVSGIFLKRVPTAIANFGSQLKDAIVVFETFKIIGSIKLLFVPGKNGKYFFTDEANSKLKRVDRLALAIQSVFKTVKGLNKFGFVGLGVLAKNAIGKLPILTLTTDSLVLLSNFCSSWECFAIGLPKACKKEAEAMNKSDKWGYRRQAIEYLEARDPLELDYFRIKYEEKAEKLAAELNELEGKARLNEDKLAKAETSGLSQEMQGKIISECLGEKKKLSAKISKASAKLQKVSERIVKIKQNDYIGLAEDLKRADIDFKVKKWEVCNSNAKQEKTKAWIKIANVIGKIAVITLALTLTAMNIWTTPFLLSLLCLGIVVDSIGLSKILLDQFWKPKPMPKHAMA